MRTSSNSALGCSQRPRLATGGRTGCRTARLLLHRVRAASRRRAAALTTSVSTARGPPRPVRREAVEGAEGAQPLVHAGCRLWGRERPPPRFRWSEARLLAPSTGLEPV